MLRIAIVVALPLALVGCGGSGATPDAAPVIDAHPHPDAAPPPRPSPIAAENARPGGDGWRLTAASDGVWAFADRPSYRPGEVVHVAAAASAATTASWSVWRMGWYGGLGGRQIAAGGPIALPVAAAPAFEPTLGVVTAPWATSFDVPLPADAVTGVYLVKLTTAAAQSYAIFVVREAIEAAPILVPIAVNTYQAYNAWGGISLYENHRSDWTPSKGHGVSFARPYQNGSGTGEFRALDLPFVEWAEQQGYDLGYATDVDLDADATLATGRRMIVMNGHNEYWSAAERAHMEAALAAGTNLAFLSANDCYWQIRYSADHRTIVAYKADVMMDPLWSSDPAHVTGRWREPPINRPENALIGIEFRDIVFPRYAGLKVTAPHEWLWDGAGVVGDEIIPGTYGVEVDHRDPNGAEPGAVYELGAGLFVNPDGTQTPAQTAWYQSPGGGEVFAAGSITWSQALAGEGELDPRVQIATANVFARFAGAVATAPATGRSALPYLYRAGVRVTTVTTALVAPAAVAALPGGDALVIDEDRVVRVDAAGTVRTIAAGFDRAQGIAVAADGTIVVVETGAGRVRTIAEDGTIATLAVGLAHPVGVIVSGATVLVAERDAGQVRAIDRRTGASTTWASGLASPFGLAARPDGTVMVADAGTVEDEGHRIAGTIRAISPDPAHALSMMCGAEGREGWNDGPLATAAVSDSVAIAAGPRGELYLADGASHRIRAVQDGAIDTLAGGTTAALADGDGRTAGFWLPRALAVDDTGAILVVDAGHHALRRITPAR